MFKSENKSMSISLDVKRIREPVIKQWKMRRLSRLTLKYVFTVQAQLWTYLNVQFNFIQILLRPKFKKKTKTSTFSISAAARSSI